MRLKRVYDLARETGILKRFIVFGSFVTAKPDPDDVDVFLVMHDMFDLGQLTGEAQLIFDHPAAQAHFGASVFWLRQLAALPDVKLSAEDVERIARLGDNKGCMALKGANRAHTTPPEADKWSLAPDLEAVGQRWGIDPDCDLAYTHGTAA